MACGHWPLHATGTAKAWLSISRLQTVKPQSSQAAKQFCGARALGRKRLEHCGGLRSALGEHQAHVVLVGKATEGGLARKGGCHIAAQRVADEPQILVPSGAKRRIGARVVLHRFELYGGLAQVAGGSLQQGEHCTADAAAVPRISHCQPELGDRVGNVQKEPVRAGREGSTCPSCGNLWLTVYRVHVSWLSENRVKRLQKSRFLWNHEQTRLLSNFPPSLRSLPIQKCIRRLQAIPWADVEVEDMFLFHDTRIRTRLADGPYKMSREHELTTRWYNGCETLKCFPKLFTWEMQLMVGPSPITPSYYIFLLHLPINPALIKPFWPIFNFLRFDPFELS